jgi:hypothetical protein
MAKKKKKTTTTPANNNNNNQRPTGEPLRTWLATDQVRRRTEAEARAKTNGEDGWTQLGVIVEESGEPIKKIRFWWNSEAECPEVDVSDINMKMDWPLEWFEQDGHLSWDLQECKYYNMLKDHDFKFLYVVLSDEGKLIIDAHEAFEKLGGMIKEKDTGSN